MTAMPAQRPGSVTTVMVLTWIVAILSIIGGLVVLFASDQFIADLGLSGTSSTAYAWGEIIYGVVVALVAIGLGNGNNFSRFLVTALMVIRLAVSVWAMFALGGNAVWTAVLTGAIALIVLVLLWNARANEFFRTN